MDTTDKSAWAKVTYQDGSIDFANIPLNITIPLVAQDVKVWTDATTTPGAKDGIKNTADLDKITDSAKPDAKTTYA